MKHPLLYSTILSVLFLCLSSYCLYGQEQQVPGRNGHARHRKPRVIYFETKKAPKLYRIAEKNLRQIRTAGAHDSRIARITRIQADSVYLDGQGYMLHDINKIELAHFDYRQADSSGWKVYFPPDSIYSRKLYFDLYIHSLAHQVKKDRSVWLAPPFKTNLITFNIAKLANLEISFGYEYEIVKNCALVIETGFQFGPAVTMSDDGPGGFNFYPLYKFHGFTSLTGYKYYFSPRGYIEPLMHYNYLEMIDTRSKFQGNGYYHNQDQYRNDVGFSFRYGKITRLGGHMILDAYVGLGVKVMLIHQLDYGYYEYEDYGDFHWANEDHTPQINELVAFWPIVNAGIKIGVGF